MTIDEAIECNKNLQLYMRINDAHHPSTAFLEENHIALDMAIRSLEAWDRVIKEMQSKKATYPTPSKENWNKEVIARNAGIDECIEIVNKYLKGGD